MTAQESGRTRDRVDRVLVARGVFDSRAQAKAAIEAGGVRADGRQIGRPSDLIGPDAHLDAVRPHPWVSRGGLKLEAALDAFGIDPAGCLCLDIGASTGGFTDVLLARGAGQVVAVDVGHGQLHARLRTDPRVLSLEGTDIRRLEPAVIPSSPDLACIDVSFIALHLVLPSLIRLLRTGAHVVALVKPQFEVGRTFVGRNGIVRDEVARADAVAAIRSRMDELGLRVIGEVPSPIVGGDGNIEHLIGARLA